MMWVINMENRKQKVIVVGGVAGGMSFATRYRRLNQEDEIIVFEKGPYVSFANCGLPYYISGEIRTKGALLVVKEQLLRDRFRLDIRSSSEVIEIDPSHKTVTISANGETYVETYDKLVLSTGAQPIRLNIPGIDQLPHFVLRNIPDLDQIMSYIKNNQPQHATIIGAGFIGLEVAENLKNKGINVTIIEKSKEVLPVVDEEMGIFIREELERNEVSVFVDNEIDHFDGNTAHLKSNDHFQTDFVISAVGVMPDSQLAKRANILTGIRGGILVDETFQTSQPDIYAVGDAIVVKNKLTQLDTLIPLASPANRQGRQLADYLSGYPIQQTGSYGTSIVKVFDLSLASTGLNEKQLANRPFRVIHLNANDHASYYPMATPIYLKVLFDPTTEKILGAQAVGQKGVDKRIDILSTAILAGLKVTQLQELELAYAPPYSSAKDIVNLAGYVASNVLLGISKAIQYQEAKRILDCKEEVLFVDVRPPFERDAYGYIQNSISIDIDKLSVDYEMIPKDKKLVVYCDTGTKSYNAEQFLRSKGYDVYFLDGGYTIASKMLKEYIYVQKY